MIVQYSSILRFYASRWSRPFPGSGARARACDSRWPKTLIAVLALCGNSLRRPSTASIDWTQLGPSLHIYTPRRPSRDTTLAVCGAHFAALESLVQLTVHPCRPSVRPRSMVIYIHAGDLAQARNANIFFRNLGGVNMRSNFRAIWAKRSAIAKIAKIGEIF